MLDKSNHIYYVFLVTINLYIALWPFGETDNVVIHFTHLNAIFQFANLSFFDKTALQLLFFFVLLSCLFKKQFIFFSCQLCWERSLFSSAFSRHLSVYIFCILGLYLGMYFLLSSQMHQGKRMYFTILFYYFHNVIWIFTKESSRIFFFHLSKNLNEVVNNNIYTLCFHW